MSADDRTAEGDDSLELPAPTSEEADVEVEREGDAPEPAELDEETRARRDAALRHVRKFGDPVLRATALPVERFDADLKAEIHRMGELMHDALGVGLAATQLGVLHLSAKARALLARLRTLRVRVTIVAQNPAGATHTGQAVATLHAPKAKRHKD